MAHHFPKVIALDTDWTIWWGWLDEHKWGKGHSARHPIQDNLERVDDWHIRDKSNHDQHIKMYHDIPKIVHDILKHGAKLAIVSRNKSSELVKRALYHFHAADPNDHDKKKSIIKLIDYYEVYDKDKTVHMHQLKEYSNASYADMILYDDEATNNMVRIKKGAVFQVSRDQKGLTWDNYQEGLRTWRSLHAIRSPYLGQDLKSYKDPMWIGFSGMDEETMKLMSHGHHRVDTKEAARWGYAMYIADDIKIAQFFADWIKEDAFGKDAKTYVCDIWVRDREKWLAAHKIWAPEEGKMLTNVHKPDPEKIAWDQEDRNDWIAKFGVKMPYVLFSRHWYMKNMDIPKNTRFNEMVVYTDIQDALIITIPLSEQQVSERLAHGKRYIRYEEQFKDWKITVPEETWKDFKDHNEHFHR